MEWKWVVARFLPPEVTFREVLRFVFLLPFEVFRGIISFISLKQLTYQFSDFREVKV